MQKRNSEEKIRIKIRNKIFSGVKVNKKKKMNNMAANANTLQCQECGITPDVRQLFQCLKTNTHVMCILCGIKNGRICKVMCLFELEYFISE